MKYAVSQAADQTNVYWAGPGTGDFDPWTTRHPEARLFDVRAEAEAIVATEGKPARFADGNGVLDTWVEDVPDEAGFRGREDTW